MQHYDIRSFDSELVRFQPAPAYSTRSNLEPGAPLLWASDGGFLAAIHWVERCFTEIRSVPCARAHLCESRLRPVSEWGAMRPGGQSTRYGIREDLSLISGSTLVPDQGQERIAASCRTTRSEE